MDSPTPVVKTTGPVVITKIRSKGPQRVGLSKMFASKLISPNEQESRPNDVGELNDNDHDSDAGLNGVGELNEFEEEPNEREEVSHDLDDESNDAKSSDFQLELDSSSDSDSPESTKPATIIKDDKEKEIVSDEAEEFSGFHEDLTTKIKPVLNVDDISKVLVEVENQLLTEAINTDYTIKLENSDEENTSPDVGKSRTDRPRPASKRIKSESSDTSFDHVTGSLEVPDTNASNKGDDEGEDMEIDASTSSSLAHRGSKAFSTGSRHSGTESPAASGRRSAKRSSTLDLLSPAFRKPFEYGWKRELVYRNSNDSSSKIQADVYYYSPKNKKIRSNREVADHLSGSELTTDNFTFFKDSLGVNDPEKEIIRSAAQRSSIGGEGFLPIKKSPKKKEIKEVKTPKETKSLKDHKTLKIPRAEPREVTTISGPKAAIGARKGAFPRIKVTAVPTKPTLHKTLLGSKAPKKSNNDGDMEMGMLPPSWSPSANKAKLQPCSIRCLGVMGLIPSLQCRLCLCLYHPECIGLGSSPNAVHSYVCKNCQQDLKDSKSSKGTGSSPCSPSSRTSPPPLTPISSLRKTNALLEGHKSFPAGAKIPSPPKLQKVQKFTEPSKLRMVPKFVKVSSTQEGASPSNVNIVKTYRPKSQPMVGGVTTWLPPSSTIQLNSNNLSNINSLQAATSPSNSPGEVDPTLAVQTMKRLSGGKKFMVIQKNNVVSISNPSSPATSSSGAKLGDSPDKPKGSVSGAMANSGQSAGWCPGVPGQPLLLPKDPGTNLVQGVSGQTLGAGGPILPKPATFFMGGSSGGAHNPPGVLLVPCFQNTLVQSSPSDSQSQAQPQQYFLINGPTANFVIGGVQGQATEDQAAGDEKTPTAKRKAEPENEATVPKRIKVEEEAIVERRFMQNFVSNVADGYNALLQVFQYLKTQELLRAARVCKMWRDLAGHRSLWHTVRLKNSHVDDWQGLIDALSRHGTEHLDLRKMLLPNDVPENEQMWRDFGQGIAKARTLTRIDLCRCPPFVIEDIAQACPQLTMLNALTIKCQSINLTSLGNLKNLVELKLKSMTGTKLENSLQPMKELINLKYLAMTTFKEIGQAGCENFKYMTNLEVLELGECVDLPEDFGEDVLMKLTKLERLRLEKGQGKFCHTFRLLAAIKELPNLNQLELINFDVKLGFDAALAQCSNVKRLLLIPTYVTQYLPEDLVEEQSDSVSSESTVKFPSATTNYLILEGATKLKATLSHFVWGVTQELLRVTELFVDQCDSTGSKSPVKTATKKDVKVTESIPILKHGSLERMENLENLTKEELKDGKSQVGQVEIQTLHKLQKQLMAALPNTKIKIVKIPFQATWKQTIADPPHH